MQFNKVAVGTDEAIGWRSGTGNLALSIYTTSQKYTTATTTYRDGKWHLLSAVFGRGIFQTIC